MIWLKRVLLCIQCLFTAHLISGQEIRPMANFSFNNRNSADRVSNIIPRLVGVNYCEDRFGNPNNAIYVFGNEYSYVNLGCEGVLKPQVGSISLWVRIEREVYTGKGVYVNPILLTKNGNINDFYEAYSMYYHLGDKKTNASTARDSLRQAVVTSKGKFSLYKWHHLVITYDDDFFSYYVDGELQRKAIKNFTTSFLESDSVLLGLTANVKNNRFMEGAIDDIEFYDFVLSDAQVKELTEAPNPNERAILLKWLGFISLAIIFLVVFYFFIRYRLNISLKKERQRLEMYNIILETELRVNRALMNPHFVFNALNSLQNFILKNENERANNYLVKFSGLMRKILESNLSNQITLEFEIDLLGRYLEIEDLRFEEDIKHEIIIQSGINPQTIYIPIMMLQPFVENAIWHGLLKKEGEKKLTISMTCESDKYLKCVIEDNGIGREQAAHYKLSKISLATSFVKQRLDLFNKIYNLECILEIEDKPERQGTIVRILLPLLMKK